MFSIVFLLAASSVSVYTQDYDCNVDGVRGKCTDIRQCPSAQKDLKLQIRPKICSFVPSSNIPIVCCLNPVLAVDRTSLLTSRLDKDGCPSLPRKYKPKENQIQPIHRKSKSWAKCVEYQDKILFECAEHENGTKYRIDRCYAHRKEPSFGAGGIDAEEGEFQHMALLGYGKDLDSAEWLCGGTLISNKFILTAAHCISTERSGTVSYIALGALRRSESHSSWDIYNVKNIIKHPEYKPPSKYNDIALLETDKTVEFNDLVVPACLHVGDWIPDKKVSATGWGALGHNLELADTMQNVPLWKVPDENCSLYFPAHRHLKQGLNTDTQVCYGDDGKVRDTCATAADTISIKPTATFTMLTIRGGTKYWYAPLTNCPASRGDSGGPLQIVSQDIYCMYLIVGVTSFGHSKCAQLGYPGIYTRVAPYVPWIESVVWP